MYFSRHPYYEHRWTQGFGRTSYNALSAACHSVTSRWVSMRILVYHECQLQHSQIHVINWKKIVSLLTSWSTYALYITLHYWTQNLLKLILNSIKRHYQNNIKTGGYTFENCLLQTQHLILTASVVYFEFSIDWWWGKRIYINIAVLICI